MPWLTAFYFGDDGLKHKVATRLDEIDPRVVGSIPIGVDESGTDVIARIGRYGPYVEIGEERASIPEDLAPDELTVEKAAELILRTGAFGEELLLIDSPVAGSGEQWDITKLQDNRPTGKWVLAGGLTPENISDAIAVAQARSVLLRGAAIESVPGEIDLAKMQALQGLAGGLRDGFKIAVAAGLLSLAGLCLVIALALGISVWLGNYWLGVLVTGILLGYLSNSGVARVGNTGARRKFKYGPLGNTVNLASRVQGATKYLGAGVVVTEPTYQNQQTNALSRRLCSVRVVNIEQSVDLYELCYQDDPETTELCQQYQAALSCYEKEELPRAIPPWPASVTRSNR